MSGNEKSIFTLEGVEPSVHSALQGTCGQRFEDPAESSDRTSGITGKNRTVTGWKRAAAGQRVGLEPNSGPPRSQQQPGGQLEEAGSHLGQGLALHRAHLPRVPQHQDHPEHL